MKFSEQWLRTWVNPQVASDELVARLSMAGLEVDSVTPVAGAFTGIVVGEVLSAEPHPDADKLRVCQVSNGSETFQVVCGAPNVRPGLKIPFAMIGAELPGDFKIKKAKLRGVESNGMLCSAAELQISEENDGLLELAADAPVGEDIRVYLQLNDQSIEVDLTPNRGDCLSLAGLAREVGALYAAPVERVQVPVITVSHADVVPVVVIAPQACPRYLGRVLRNVDLSRPTPLWMVERLRRADVRSIDAAVDITNYVMLELGQPMHAFDLKQISGGIRVRMAEEGEKLVLLGGQEVSLRADTLVIADHSRALAIAGVMGGESSGVTAQTCDLFLEAAFFDTIALAGKARSYGLHTDASHRFERGVDSQLTRDGACHWSAARNCWWRSRAGYRGGQPSTPAEYRTYHPAQ
jgi:phenylalanyl-tRNA synthetase beta chain